MARLRLVDGNVVPMSPAEESARDQEELAWSTVESPARQRKIDFIRAKSSALSFEEEEKDILLAGYLEVKLVRLAVLLGQSPGSVDTPVVDAFNAVFPGQTKLQIAQTIENRAQSYLTASATALANKIKGGG